MPYLYRSPVCSSGTKASQTPPVPRGASGVRPACQSLKSPMTLTLSASGAHTATLVPCTPSTTRGWAPIFSWARSHVPSANRYRSSSEKIEGAFTDHVPPLVLRARSIVPYAAVWRRDRVRPRNSTSVCQCEERTVILHLPDTGDWGPLLLSLDALRERYLQLARGSR